MKRAQVGEAPAILHGHPDPVWHDGVGLFTVGQRRGLPALGKPHYVRSIRPATER